MLNPNQAQTIAGQINLAGLILAANGPDSAIIAIKQAMANSGFQHQSSHCNEIYFDDGSRIVVNDSFANPKKLYAVMHFKYLNKV